MRVSGSLLVAGVLMVSAASSAQPVPIVFVKVAEVHTLPARGMPPVLIDVRSREESILS